MLETYLQVLRYIRQVWMHRRLAIISSMAVAILGWAYVLQLPDIYRADTRLYVDTSSMLNRLLAGVALDSSDIEEEFLRLARRSLLSRPNLERVARDADLLINAVTPEARELVLRGLADRVQITGDSTQTRGKENLFHLAYDHEDPALALTVVRAVNSVFIETVLGLSRRDTDKMDDFLVRQIQQYERRLEEAETRRKQFSQSNAGLLPGEGRNYFSMLQAARDQLREAQLALTRSERVRDSLQEQLAAVATPAASVVATPLGQQPSAPETSLPLVESLEQRLLGLESMFTDNHPDVIAVRKQLERARGATRSEESQEENGRPVSDSVMDRLQAQQLRVELARADAAVASERAAVEEYQGRVREVEGSVNTIPEVEAELARLDRDYSILRSQYEELVSRRESARLSRDADLTVEDGIFQVLEPPQVSSLPVAPNRLQLVSLVLGASIAVGGGLGVLLSLFNPTIGDVGQLREISGVRVLGRLGVVRSPSEISHRRRVITLYASAFASLLCAYAVIVWQAMS